MSLSHVSNPFEYENTRDRILKYAENRPLAVGAESNPNLTSPIHDDNDTLTGGLLTIGYGLNMDDESVSAGGLVDAIEYALTGSVSPDANLLTAEQQLGLSLLHAWKTDGYADTYMLDLVASNFWSTSPTQQEIEDHNQLMSLSLTDEMATRLLRAAIWGLNDEQGNAILPNREAGLTNWLAGQNPYGINAGAVPQSNERAALMSLFYNQQTGADTALIGPGLLTALATDNRAEAWWEIRYNSNGDDEDGVAARRYYERQVFGLYSDYDDLELSQEAEYALRDNEARSVFRMNSLQRDESLDQYDNTFGDQIDKANSEGYGWNTEGTDFVVETREEAFEPAKTWLIDHYVAPLGHVGDVDNIFIDAPNTKNGISATPGVIDRDAADEANDLIFGEAGGDTIRGGACGDVAYGDHGSCKLDDTKGYGQDQLFGGAGDDALVGGSGNDSLDGGADDDLLYGDNFDGTCGSDGADTLLGGKGDDRFIVGGDDKILDPEVGDRIGFLGGGSEPIGLHGGVKSGGDAEDTGDAREEYDRPSGEYVEETDAGTVTYYATENTSDLTIDLPDGSTINVENWDNGEAGITLTEAPDDDKYDDAGELSSPLVLDLDGDGIELTDPWRSWTYFDIDEDGFAERTGWVSPDDGLLALDGNANGTIDDISELFAQGK